MFCFIFELYHEPRLTLLLLPPWPECWDGRFQLYTRSGISLTAVVQYWALWRLNLSKFSGTPSHPQLFHLLGSEWFFLSSEDGRGKPRPTKARSKKKTPGLLSPPLLSAPPALFPAEEVLRLPPRPKSPGPAMGPMAAEGGPPPTALNVVPPGVPGEETEVRPRPIIPMLYVLPRANSSDGDREHAAHPQLAPMELGPEEEDQAQAGDSQVGD